MYCTSLCVLYPFPLPLPPSSYTHSRVLFCVRFFPSLPPPPSPMAPVAPSSRLLPFLLPLVWLLLVPLACRLPFQVQGAREVGRQEVGAGTWCVARSDAKESDVQDALDWACGQMPEQGNVDCTPILSGGACDSPDTLLAHASFAFNAYFQRQNQAPGTCDFNNVATTTATDPSSGGCVYPSSSTNTGLLTTSNVSSSALSGGANGHSSPSHYYYTLAALLCSWMALTAVSNL